ncbi:MAG: hypothetical protein FIB00_10765 [Chloroflexi bacterium]|nr:hypothetical protein [Chloroflexota bacterium]PWB45722.1 MAG: hypothetical protein C3F10_05350 [Dehalococcoidia bacterium]
MPRFYVSIPYGWLEAESPTHAVRRVIADDPRTDHEGVTFLVREEGANRLVLIVVGDKDEPTPVTQDVMDDWEYLFE